MARTPRPFIRKASGRTAADPSEFWRVGERLKKARLAKRLTPTELAHKISVTNPKYSLPVARINSIETNDVVANLQELAFLCETLEIDIQDVIAPRYPWVLLRASAIEGVLRTVLDGNRRFLRIGGAHQFMIDTHPVYYYVPLDQENIPDAKSEGHLQPSMRKFLFEVKHVSEEIVLEGLDSHGGEEIVFLLEGELEFFFRQPGKTEPTRLELKQGDCLQYSSLLPHGYRCPRNNKVARALFVYVEPKAPTTPQFADEARWSHDG